LFIILDHLFGQVPSDVDWEEFCLKFDAWLPTTHDVYANLLLKDCMQVKLWKALAEDANIGFVPAVNSVFNRALGARSLALYLRLEQEDK